MTLRLREAGEEFEGQFMPQTNPELIGRTLSEVGGVLRNESLPLWAKIIGVGYKSASKFGQLKRNLNISLPTSSKLKDFFNNFKEALIPTADLLAQIPSPVLQGIAGSIRDSYINSHMKKSTVKREFARNRPDVNDLKKISDIDTKIVHSISRGHENNILDDLYSSEEEQLLRQALNFTQET